MNELRVVLAFLVLGVGVCAAISERPPIFRWGYEVSVYKQRGKSWQTR